MASRPAPHGDDISSRTIVLIPARLGSTRLPDKPLAIIAGEPMIVQVWRRALRGGGRPGRRRLRRARDRRGGARGRRRGRAHRSGPAVRAPTGSSPPCRALDPERRYERVVNLQGDLPTLDPEAVRDRCWSRWKRWAPTWRRWPTPPRTSTTCATPTWSRPWSASTRPPRARPRPLLHPRHRPHRPRPGLAPYRHLRLHPRGAGALRRPAAQSARAARAAGAAARAGARHEHRRAAGRRGAVRRRHSRATSRRPAASWRAGP